MKVCRVLYFPLKTIFFNKIHENLAVKGCYFPLLFRHSFEMKIMLGLAVFSEKHNLNCTYLRDVLEKVRSGKGRVGNDGGVTGRVGGGN